jgi:sigma-B regulation protein RsbU (phosphoserine phosphatase)
MKFVSAKDAVANEPTKPASAYTILLVDDEKMARMVAKRRLAKLHYRILEANDGVEALAILEREFVDLVLSDRVMPGLDGLQLCEAMKRDDRYRTIHFILMTFLDHPAQIAEALRRGADDFLPKTASDQEIISRVSAGLRSRQLMLDLAETNRLLSKKQAELDAELQSASDFVQSLLPPPGHVLSGIRLHWVFLPSSQLGGDLFQVAKWGNDHIGFMVLDMSGHGISAALRAVSLAMFFKGEHIQKAFPTYDPGDIVTFLNRKYPITDEGEYFTIWVGVWQSSTHLLRYASAGHPGSVLIRSGTNALVLGKQSWPIGFSSEQVYATHTVTVHPGNRLYLFSDGVYEVMNAHGEIWGRKRLLHAIEHVAHQPMMLGLTKIIDESRSWNNGQDFDDDVALLGLEFREECCHG